MIIAVASGKGGTGKTTVATNMAASSESAVQLLDCDVEEPNAHLFLELEMQGSETVSVPVPKVEMERCTLCRECAEICAYHAIAVIADQVITFSELCHGCGGCSLVCPTEAISEVPREIGVLEWGRTGTIDFVHGRLRIGEAMSPPLIRAVKGRLDESKLVIIDAPPGTSCPVIEAVRGADYALLVTEPTPFGLNDLILAVETVRALDIPCGVLINRAGLGDEAVQAYCRRERIPVEMEIGFDRRIAESYSRGELLVDSMPEWRSAFRQLVERVVGRSSEAHAMRPGERV
jgi:MinD superfamily P-loop ATPase